MKKDRSNVSKPSNKDFSLPRAKILRGRKNFQRLFQKEAETLRNSLVNLRFRIYSDLDGGCRMGFVVKKNLGKATKRNRIKRLLRESYRLNQHILTELFKDNSYTFHGVLMANTVEMDFDSAREQVVDLLRRARKQVLPIIQSGS